MRGDQPIKNTEKQSVIAFTPHARGSTSKIKSSRPLSEIYPACAGINPQLWQGGRYLLHLPRMRGDQPTMIARRCQEKLFTPHARGSIQVNDRFIESTSIYPACAGSTYADPRRWFCSQIYPACAGINPCSIKEPSNS